MENHLDMLKNEKKVGLVSIYSSVDVLAEIVCCYSEAPLTHKQNIQYLYSADIHHYYALSIYTKFQRKRLKPELLRGLQHTGRLVGEPGLQTFASILRVAHEDMVRRIARAR